MGTINPKIYIIHGWAYETQKWQPFLDLLSQKGIDPVLLSVPGLTAPLEEEWTLKEYVSWLHQNLAKEKDPVVLLGHSNGGRIILAFALKYPEKVKQLILIDSAGVRHNELKIRLKRIVFKSIAKIGKKLQKSEILRGLLYRLARERDYQNASPIVRKTMRNLIEIDLTPKLSEIKTPTLIIWGAEDKITPLIDGKIMHDKIAQAELQIISDARHSPQFTHPEKVADIVIKKLE